MHRTFIEKIGDALMLDRRRFLQESTIVSMAPTVPLFLSRSVGAVPHADQPILVVVQMDGGNDGINTVVPYADEAYSKFRIRLRLPTSECIKVNDEVALHPRLAAFDELLQDGRLAIVQSVGYPNPDRSHFRSMAIWHSARFEDDRHSGPGWLGDCLSVAAARGETTSTNGDPDAIYVGTETLPTALVGRRCVPVTINSAADLRLTFQGLAGSSSTPEYSETEDLSAYLHRTVAQAYATAEQFGDESRSRIGTVSTNRDATAGNPSGESPRFPTTKLGQRLKVVSQMIKSGSSTRIYYTSQAGYDTHANQLGTHGSLLFEFSQAIKGLLDDLGQAGLGDRVMVMAFSEFGRRVQENGSMGTDHGTAGPLFLAGGGVQPGVFGRTPDLSDLVAGDLKYDIDFRRIYTGIVRQWLGLSLSSPLKSTNPYTECFAHV